MAGGISSISDESFRPETVRVVSAQARRNTSVIRASDDRTMGKSVVMIGPAFEARGGISSVVGVYRACGLFDRARVRYLASCPDGGTARKLVTAFRAWGRFLALLAAGRVRLAHVHLASRASFWRKSMFLWPAFLARVPVVIHLHGGAFATFYGEESGPWRRRFIRATFARAGAVIVLSRSWRDWVRHACPEASVVMIHNPVLVPEPGAAPDREVNVILGLNRLEPLKGTHDLLQAVAALVERRPDIRLRLGGDGEIDAVRARVAELGLQRHVELLGWVGPQQRERELARAGIYALPSYREAMPMGVLEAMAAGLPVVATAVGGIPDMIDDGIEGRLLPPGDVAALVAALESLLDAPDCARAMGEAARLRVVHDFSAQAIVPRLEALYATVARGV